MKTKTITLSLGLILVAGGLYAADPFDGTWKLNESKSKLVQGTDKDTKIVYNSHSVPDKVTMAESPSAFSGGLYSALVG